MEFAYRCGLFLIAALLSTSVLPRIMPWGYYPDLFLILICSFALLRGRKKGLFWGVLGALIQDLYSLGTNILIKPVLGILAGYLEGKIYKSNFFMAPFIILLFSMLNGTLSFLVQEDFLFQIPFGQALMNVIVPGALIDCVMSFLLYPILYSVERRWFSLREETYMEVR